jgi:hypothetical protein
MIRGCSAKDAPRTVTDGRPLYESETGRIRSPLRGGGHPEACFGSAAEGEAERLRGETGLRFSGLAAQREEPHSGSRFVHTDQDAGFNRGFVLSQNLQHDATQVGRQHVLSANLDDTGTPYPGSRPGESRSRDHA